MEGFKNFDQGVITALITPLTRDLNIKSDAIEPFINFQLKNSVKEFFILGT